MAVNAALVGVVQVNMRVGVARTTLHSDLRPTRHALTKPDAARPYGISWDLAYVVPWT